MVKVLAVVDVQAAVLLKTVIQNRYESSLIKKTLLRECLFYIVLIKLFEKYCM